MDKITSGPLSAAELMAQCTNTNPKSARITQVASDRCIAICKLSATQQPSEASRVSLGDLGSEACVGLQRLRSYRLKVTNQPAKAKRNPNVQLSRN